MSVSCGGDADGGDGAELDTEHVALVSVDLQEAAPVIAGDDADPNVATVEKEVVPAVEHGTRLSEREGRVVDGLAVDDDLDGAVHDAPVLRYGCRDECLTGRQYLSTPSVQTPCRAG